MAQRTKASVLAVESARKHALLVVLGILFVHLAAIAQFTRGFLLTRPVLSNMSSEASLEKPPFDRAVVLVVDALRHDFVQASQDAPDLPYLRHFPVHEISEDPARSFALKFIADPPTTTLQRLKGLTTGSLPAFIDAGFNFAGFKIDEDNWVSQAAKHLGPVSFVGDDTWEALFAHEFSENYPYPSLNVRDLDTVDNGVKQVLPAMVKNTSNKVVIGHMLGVDHVGHRYGPSHPAMATKLDETFTFVKEIAELLDDRTVLMVMGDHGMDRTGNHGGDSQDELEAALWVYSNRAAFAGEGHHTVGQIDLVPTLSGLLGLPIPFNSLGFPIRQAFTSKAWDIISKNTAAQIRRYAEVVGLPTSKMEVADSQERKEGPRGFQRAVLEAFTEAWIEFDVAAMNRGIALLATSIMTALLLYNSVQTANLALIPRFQATGAVVGAFIGVLYNITVFKDSRLDFIISVCFYAGVGIVLSSILPAIPHNSLARPSLWSLAATVVLFIEIATAFSNSFVIWESRILQFLGATVLVALVTGCARTNNPVVMYLAAWYSCVLLLVLRLSSGWVVCREETASRCSTTFFDPESSLFPTWTLFATGLLGLALPYFLKRFWAIGQNNVGTASLLLNMTPLAMVFVIAYWSLDNAEARGWIPHDSFGLQTGKLLLGRLALTFGAVGGIIIWWRNNVPIEIVLDKNTGRPEKIEGYNNIHGSDVLLTSVCLFWSFAVTNKPPGILALAGLLYTSLGSLDFLDISEAKYTLMTPVLFDLLSHAYFYFTGHQATIPSIQWDIAFVAARTVSFPWSPIAVFLNTFGPFLLCGMVCVFSALWRRPPFKDAKQPVTLVLRTALGLFVVSGARTTGSIIAAYSLRRHLMAWKIFAPRFMFAALSLLATDLAALVGLAFSGHTIKKVTVMFGYF